MVIIDEKLAWEKPCGGGLTHKALLRYPFLAEALHAMAGDGVRRALAFVTSAYSSYSGCRQYLEDIARARANVGPSAPIVDKLRTFHDHPGFVEANAERYPGITLRSAVKGYALAALAVVIAGSWLPFVAKDISDMMGWGQSFVGTMLVAAVTSAPEAAVTISALRIGALDMAIANLLGSNLFDIVILAIDDLFYTKGPLLAHVDASHALTAFTAVMMSALVAVGLVFRPQGRAMLGLTWISLGLFMLYVLNSWILFEHAL